MWTTTTISIFILQHELEIINFFESNLGVFECLNSEFQTPLHVAISMGHLNFVNVNASISKTERKGIFKHNNGYYIMYYIHYAAQFKNIEIIHAIATVCMQLYT
jgi:hypothetical protein